MKTTLLATLTLACVSMVAPAAHAAGCLKGAAVGGVAGHVAHHHGLLGAAAGCVIGRHHANKKEREQLAHNQSSSTHASSR